ncbi:hypothetical protein J5U18_10865 [Sphingobacteriaceae bacterium WQ 2009]|uniref:DoxX family membrane protein n=1 Tax=Rhinopithecimicrobium faecis TaxID=2820698 RepID=A0A8T4HBA4_9SPHI|nr:hypothetical protein [Sphingobacteriaceae bacterium WQ 2009]
MNTIKNSKSQTIVRILMGLAMLFAGISHLTFSRGEFQAQVPNWVPLSKDLVVLLSGVVEILLGLAMLLLKNMRRTVGISLAIFYLLIFPGNIAQYIEQRDAFGLDSDQARFTRLFFQPILMIAALWSTGFWNRRR